MNYKNFLCLLCTVISLIAADIPYSKKQNHLGEFEYFIEGQQVSKDAYLRKKVEFARTLINLTEKDRSVFDAIGDYNRTGNKKYWTVIHDELKDGNSPYHTVISNKIRLRESEILAYLEYARNESGYEERVAIAVALRRAPPQSEVFELLEDLTEDPNNYGLVANTAKTSIMKLKAKQQAASTEEVTAQKTLLSSAEPKDHENASVDSPVAEVPTKTPAPSHTEFTDDNEGDEPVISWGWLLLLSVFVAVIIFLACRCRK